MATEWPTHDACEHCGEATKPGEPNTLVQPDGDNECYWRNHRRCVEAQNAWWDLAFRRMSEAVTLH